MLLDRQQNYESGMGYAIKGDWKVVKYVSTVSRRGAYHIRHTKGINNISSFSFEVDGNTFDTITSIGKSPKKTVLSLFCLGMHYHNVEDKNKIKVCRLMIYNNSEN